MSMAGKASASRSEVMSVNVWLTWTLTPRAWLWQAGELPVPAARPSPVPSPLPAPVPPACRMVMTASVPALVSSGSPAARQVVKSMWNPMTRAFMVRPRKDSFVR
ncbi:MAG: hypothetical protein ACRD0H_24485 [Actinomycetes bacterium]